MQDMSITIYFESGKRFYKDFVSQIYVTDIEGKSFLSIEWLNVNTGFYDKMSWQAESVARISAKVL